MDLARIEEQEAHLCRAELRAQEDIARLQALIPELERDAHRAAGAQRLLLTLKDSLAAIQEDRRLIIEETARLKSVPGIG